MDILVTGGTVFVSRRMAQYFADRGHRVRVLNRGTRPQEPGVTAIVADRHDLGGRLKGLRFDAVVDVTAYTRRDVEELHRALGEFDRYVLISSSAVYPETLPQPFRESQPCGPNVFWGEYGTGKIGAERYAREHIPQGYIVRPPYLYGPGNDVYREAFVFDCAEAGRPFYLPKDGALPLQFFNIEDLCRFVEILLERRPEQRVFNVGDPETVTARRWAALCYQAAGRAPEFRSVPGDVPQRSYFPFADYGYTLDVSAQRALMPEVRPMEQGLAEAYRWYRAHRELVRRKPLMEFIDRHLT